ncbi:MAG: hypothetical protein Q4C47_05780 [Planctomycetia bacterium]|nr:hypothetical protein [Planctomycetia bacterium]
MSDVQEFLLPAFRSLHSGDIFSIPSVQLGGMLILSLFPLLPSRRTSGVLAVLTLMAISLWLYLFSTMTAVFTPAMIFLAILPMGICLMAGYAPMLSGRPVFVSGGRSLVILATAMAGWIFVGPVELLFPASALRQSDDGGAPIGVSVIAVYVLIFVLIAMSRRPRFVIFHANAQTLLPAMRKVVAAIHPTGVVKPPVETETNGTGTNVETSGTGTISVERSTEDPPDLCGEAFVSVPSMRFHLWIESFPTHSQVTGFAMDSQIERGLWNRFRKILRAELPSIPEHPDLSAHIGQTFGLGLIFVWFALVTFLADPDHSIRAIHEFLSVWFIL